MKRDFISIADLAPADLEEIFSLAQGLKADRQKGRSHPIMAGKTLAMIFEKPSLRTRVTFEAGMVQLGGYAIYLSSPDIGLGTRETVPDIARNLSRWVDLIMARTFSHQAITELAQAATVPVINGLSDLLHPCQVLAALSRRYTRDAQRSGLADSGFEKLGTWSKREQVVANHPKRFAKKEGK